MKTTTKLGPLPKSEVYKAVFDHDLMITAFGKLDPTISERTQYFFEQYMHWRENRIRIKRGKMAPVKRLLRESGLKDMWEYQVNMNEVRFAKAEHLAWVRLTADIDQYVITPGGAE